MIALRYWGDIIEWVVGWVNPVVADWDNSEVVDSWHRSIQNALPPATGSFGGEGGLEADPEGVRVQRHGVVQRQ